MLAVPNLLRLLAVLYAATPALTFWLAENTAVPALLPTFLLLLPSLPIAIGIVSVRRWAFYALLVHAAFSAAIGAIDVAFYSVHAWPVVVDLLVVAALVSQIATPDKRKPYLSPNRRGFRLHPRVDINMFAEIDFGTRIAMGQTYDLSHGGAYVQCLCTDVGVGQKCRVRLQMRDRELRIQARVVRVCASGDGGKPEGLALQFSNIQRSDTRTIDAFFTLRQHPRAAIILPVELSSESVSLRTEAVNLSLGGCFVRGGKGEFAPGDRISAKLELDAGDPLECIAEVAWLASEDAQQPGLALQFKELTKDDKRRLRARLERGQRL